MQNDVVIYTDGACKGNPGPGGWGALLRSADGTEKEMFGGELDTTNNRMEMMAVIQALAVLKRPCNVILHLDSQYVLKGITEWLAGWKAKGWKTAAKQPVKNVDLWQQLDPLVSQAGPTLDFALGQKTVKECGPVAAAGPARQPGWPHHRLALGQRPRRRPRQRAGRRLGKPGR